MCGQQMKKKIHKEKKLEGVISRFVPVAKTDNAISLYHHNTNGGVREQNAAH